MKPATIVSYSVIPLNYTNKTITIINHLPSTVVQKNELIITLTSRFGYTQISHFFFLLKKFYHQLLQINSKQKFHSFPDRIAQSIHDSSRHTIKFVVTSNLHTTPQQLCLNLSFNRLFHAKRNFLTVYYV